MTLLYSISTGYFKEYNSSNLVTKVPLIPNVSNKECNLEAPPSSLETQINGLLKIIAKQAQWNESVITNLELIIPFNQSCVGLTLTSISRISAFSFSERNPYAFLYSFSLKIYEKIFPSTSNEEVFAISTYFSFS